MRLDVQGSTVARRSTVTRHVEQRALFELARYGDHIDTVRMRLTDRPPSAAHPYHCGLAVTVVHGDGSSANVFARSEGDDVFRLIESVLARAASLVGGEIERAQAAEQARAEWRTLAAAGRGA